MSTKELSVGMMHWCYPPVIGGVETFLQQLSKELVKKNTEVHVLTGGKKEETTKDDGVFVHKIPTLARYKQRHVSRAKLTHFQRYMKKFIVDNRINILHLHNFQRVFRPAITKGLCKIAEEDKIPTVLHIHNPVTRKEEIRLISGLNWDRILCVSNWITKSVKPMVKNPGKVLTVYNGTDTKKFKPGLNTKNLRREIRIDGDKVILCPSRFVRRSGAFHRRKNLTLILKSILRIEEKTKNFKIIFTGKDRNAREKIIERAEKLGVLDKILIANLNFDDMPILYNLSEVVLLPSMNEAFGIVYIEGMSCGKPVIGCRSGAVPEVIADGKTGYLINPNVGEISKRVTELLINKNKAKRLGANGKKLVEKKFSIAKIADDILKIYSELM